MNFIPADCAGAYTIAMQIVGATKRNARGAGAASFGACRIAGANRCLRGARQASCVIPGEIKIDEFSSLSFAGHATSKELNAHPCVYLWKRWYT
jgi:hypothetical protein